MTQSMSMPDLMGSGSGHKAPSPAKVPVVSREATKALQDSITTLLGKRRLDDGSVVEDSVAAKKARPLKGKKVCFYSLPEASARLTIS
jgi:hypothetical protein